MAYGVLADSLRAIIKQKLVIQRRENDAASKGDKFAPLNLAEETLKPEIRDLLETLFDDAAEATRQRGRLLQESDDDKPSWRILAILLYIGCEADVVRQFIQSRCIDDSILPMQKQAVGIVFPGVVGQRFFEKQFIFCPIILREGQEEVYEESLRLPFLTKEKFPRQGSSGSVYKVLVAKGHYASKDSTWGLNKQARFFAWKEFRAGGAGYKKEMENLQKILKGSSSIKHENIVLPHGSLIRGGSYSIYFDVASCDLGQYLDLDDPHNSSIPLSQHEDIAQTETFLGYFRGLVDALDFLHTRLIPDGAEKLCILHGDLKPANILVFNIGTRDEVWKIHDFGVSRVKTVHRREKKGLGHLLRPSNDNDYTISGTDFQRQGPFLAPETRLLTDADEGPVKAKSDVWSLGCILTIVLSFLVDGPATVKQFQKQRSDDSGSDDVFFVSKRVRGSPRIVLNPGVESWLTELPALIKDASALGRTSSDKVEIVITQMVYLLKEHILKTDPNKRATSEEMKKGFVQAMGLFRDEEYSSFRRSSTFKQLMHVNSANAIKPPSNPARTWKLRGLPDAISCRFSFRGETLAFFSATEITIHSMNEPNGVLDTDWATPERLSPKPLSMEPADGAEWGGFDLSSDYLVAFTRRDYFDCCILTFPVVKKESPVAEKVRVVTAHHIIVPLKMLGIRKVILSSDSEFLITVLQQPNCSKHYVFSSHTKDVLLWRLEPSANIASPQTRRKAPSSGAPGSTLPAPDLTPPTLPWKHNLLNPPHHTGRFDIMQIEEAHFSADSDLLVLLSQNSAANSRVFYGWSKDKNGEFTSSTSRKIEASRDGTFDTDKSWTTAFTPLMTSQLSVLSLTFTKNLSQYGFDSKSANWASQELQIELLDVLPISKTDKHYIFIGREIRKRGTVKALYAPISKSSNFRDKMSKLHFDFVFDLECPDWKAGRDGAAVSSDGMCFLVARLDGNGIVRRIYRPDAPRI